MKDPFESGARLCSRAELNMHQFLGPARYDVHLRSDVCPVCVFLAVNLSIEGTMGLIPDLA